MYNKISPCGANCEECLQYKNNICVGCIEGKGKACWVNTSAEAVCVIYECAINKNHLNHCGECQEIPCENWKKCTHIGMTEEEIKEYEKKSVTKLLSLNTTKQS